MNTIPLYSSEELWKLRELAKSSSFVSFLTSVLDMSFEGANLVKKDDLVYRNFENRLINTGRSTLISGKYTLMYRLLQLPLEEMPLFINDTNSDTCLIAKWRLEINK